MSSADFQCLMRTSFPSSLYFKSLKGIKWKKWCLIQIYLWYKAVLLLCTFWFFLLFKWKHALMCHWSTMHFYLLPDKWNEVFMLLSCFGKNVRLVRKSGAHGSYVGLPYHIIQYHQLHIFLTFWDRTDSSGTSSASSVF